MKALLLGLLSSMATIPATPAGNQGTVTLDGAGVPLSSMELELRWSPERTYRYEQRSIAFQPAVFDATPRRAFSRMRIEVGGIHVHDFIVVWQPQTFDFSWPILPDGVLDFAGPSGETRLVIRNGQATVTITDPAILSQFAASGQITVSWEYRARTRIDGAGAHVSAVDEFLEMSSIEARYVPTVKP